MLTNWMRLSELWHAYTAPYERVAWFAFGCWQREQALNQQALVNCWEPRSGASATYPQAPATTRPNRRPALDPWASLAKSAQTCSSLVHASARDEIGRLAAIHTAWLDQQGADTGRPAQGDAGVVDE